MKLLIADDEMIIQKGLLGLPWHSIGISEIQCADNGTESLKILHSFCPDVILADIEMPGMTGLELAKIVYEQRNETKVILLSGYGTFEYARKAIQYGVFEYLLKPSSPQEIMECVKRALEEIAQENTKAQKEKIKIENDRIFGMEEEISEVLQYIEKNYMTDISLVSLSEYLHFSTAYVSKLIKKKTGYNFIKLLTMMRMLKAAELLATTNLKVYVICEKVGITDQRYFSQIFRKTFGHTPLEYQKLTTQKNYHDLAEFIKAVGNEQ